MHWQGINRRNLSEMRIYEVTHNEISPFTYHAQPQHRFMLLSSWHLTVLFTNCFFDFYGTL